MEYVIMLEAEVKLSAENDDEVADKVKDIIENAFDDTGLVCVHILGLEG